MRRTRRRWRVAIPAMFVAGIAGWAAPTWATRGWLAVVPGWAVDAAIAMLFAEAADSELESFLPGAGEPIDIPPPDSYYTRQVPQSPWRRRLLAWRLAQEWEGFEQLRTAERQFPPGVYTDARGVSQRSHYVLMVAERVECAPLVRAVGSVVANAKTTDGSRGIALRVLESGGPHAEAALPLVWRAAPAVGTGQSMQFIGAVKAIDPAYQRAVGDDAALAGWYRRVLRRPMSKPLAMQFALAARNEGTPKCQEVAERFWQRLEAER
ncbi:MAG: hypothetical protein ACF8R7_09755 [Phycisphaerales bacterium JB039]